MVTQHVKALGLTYKARIQIDMFEDLFTSRLKGSGAKIPRAMELQFLEKPKTASELRIAKVIREYAHLKMNEAKAEIKKQEQRLAIAERTLLTKVTKKAQTDQRVSSTKIIELGNKIKLLSSNDLTDSDSRIYPGQYAPLVIELNGERVIAPFRYLLRPRGQQPDFDRKYNGSYNMRRDSLDRVVWWRNLYGKQHGLMQIQAFYENVRLHDLEHRRLRLGEVEQNVILRFKPEALDQMTIPCIFDYNTEGEFPLQSFALITDTPNPEVAAVGHDRTPVIMKDEYISLWLDTSGRDLKAYEPVFTDKQPTYLEHQLVA